MRFKLFTLMAVMLLMALQIARSHAAANSRDIFTDSSQSSGSSDSYTVALGADPFGNDQDVHPTSLEAPATDLPVAPITASSVPTDGLVAYYPFNGNANDESGNGNHATAYGGVTLVADRYGYANRAYSFNGSDGCFLASDSDTLDVQNSITLAAWIKTTDPHSTSELGRIVAKHYTHGSRSYDIHTRSSPDGLGFNLFKTDDTRFNLDTDDSYFDGNWHLIAATYSFSSGVMGIYVDGQLIQASNVGQFNLMQTNVPLSIGCYLLNSTGTLRRAFFNGSIDDVRIYNRALSEAEIQALYQTISDVRITNVRDVSFTVSWLTNVESTGEVRYGTDPNDLNQTAYDERGAATSDDTHYAIVSDLQSETTYYFDVVSGGTIDDNGGAHYSVTTGPSLGLPASDLIYGQVFKEGGTTVAEGTIVYITLSDVDEVDTSGQAAPLSSLVDSDGYWRTSLGNARTADLSDYFIYSASGDRVELEANGAGDGVGCERVDTANDTPATDIVLNVSKCPITWPMSLQSGWNHISLPVEPITTPLMAEEVCDDINAQSGHATEIDHWHNGGWDGHICGLPFNNFELVLGSDYFIKSSSASTWTIEGYEVTEPVSLTLHFGWNSIGIPHTDAYTAESLCDEIISQGVTAVEIDRWHNGGWEGHVCGLPFNDFTIERGIGYFIKASSAGTVIPDAPATPPRPFDKLRAPPRGTADLRQPSRLAREAVPLGGQVIAVRDLRLANFTDSAVTLSWITDEATTGYVLYGETPELGQVAVDVRGAAVQADTHVVTLAKLKPETTYYFKVVSGAEGAENKSAPDTFTTAPSPERVPESDTVYGQVFLADGETPATGTLVYLKLQDHDGVGSTGEAMLLSALVDEQGYWYANLGNGHVSDLSGPFKYSTNGDKLLIEAQGARRLTVDTANDAQAPDMILNETTDPTSITMAAFSTSSPLSSLGLGLLPLALTMLAGVLIARRRRS